MSMARMHKVCFPFPRPAVFTVDVARLVVEPNIPPSARDMAVPSPPRPDELSCGRLFTYTRACAILCCPDGMTSSSSPSPTTSVLSLSLTRADTSIDPPPSWTRGTRREGGDSRISMTSGPFTVSSGERDSLAAYRSAGRLRGRTSDRNETQGSSNAFPTSRAMDVTPSTPQ